MRFTSCSGWPQVSATQSQDFSSSSQCQLNGNPTPISPQKYARRAKTEAESLFTFARSGRFLSRNVMHHEISTTLIPLKPFSVLKDNTQPQWKHFTWLYFVKSWSPYKLPSLMQYTVVSLCTSWHCCPVPVCSYVLCCATTIQWAWTCDVVSLFSGAYPSPLPLSVQIHAKLFLCL